MAKMWFINERFARRDNRGHKWRKMITCVQRGIITLVGLEVVRDGDRPIVAHLAPNEAIIVTALMLREFGPVSVEDMLWYLYGDDEPEWGANCLVVYIGKIRKKLLPLGVTALNSRGRGWEFIIMKEETGLAK